MEEKESPAFPEIQKRRDCLILKTGNAEMCVTKDGITLKVR